MKRLIPFLFCFWLPLISSGKERPFQQEQERPNILFIVSEDNGPELGCYGTPIKTPHLDELARQGILFKNAYKKSSLLKKLLLYSHIVLVYAAFNR